MFILTSVLSTIKSFVVAVTTSGTGQLDKKSEEKKQCKRGEPCSEPAKGIARAGQPGDVKGPACTGPECTQDSTKLREKQNSKQGGLEEIVKMFLQIIMEFFKMLGLGQRDEQRQTGAPQEEASAPQGPEEEGGAQNFEDFMQMLMQRVRQALNGGNRQRSGGAPQGPGGVPGPAPQLPINPQRNYINPNNQPDSFRLKVNDRDQLVIRQVDSFGLATYKYIFDPPKRGGRLVKFSWTRDDQ